MLFIINDPCNHGCVKLSMIRIMHFIDSINSTIAKMHSVLQYVTGFRKTDHIVTIDIARNTDLKY